MPKRQRQIKNKCARCGKGVYKNNTICTECKKIEYLIAYNKKNRKKKSKYIVCRNCFTGKGVRPFVGLCQKCYNKLFLYLKDKRGDKNESREKR